MLLVSKFAVPMVCCPLESWNPRMQHPVPGASVVQLGPSHSTTLCVTNIGKVLALTPCVPSVVKIALNRGGSVSATDGLNVVTPAR
jgi:hypothetical protein